MTAARGGEDLKRIARPWIWAVRWKGPRKMFWVTKLPSTLCVSVGGKEFLNPAHRCGFFFPGTVISAGSIPKSKKTQPPSSEFSINQENSTYGSFDCRR
jgi:hypothetical protein